MTLRKGSIERPVTRIPTPSEIHQELVAFSFKYIELGHEKYGLPDAELKKEYLGCLLERLKQISTMKFSEFRQAGKTLRSHQIKWCDTTDPDGYAHLSEQMQACEPWQFSITRENLGRIHGLILGNVFYVVWIDHDHKLYSQ